MNRFLLYLYSTPNLVGTLLALAGLAAHFTGWLGAFWVPIVIGLYLIGALATPRRTAPDLQLEQQLSEAELRGELERYVRGLKGKLPADAMGKVRSIQESVQAALPRLAELQAGGDPNANLVRQTVLDYLPATLGNYLKLPRAYANIHPIQDGKTAHQVLVEQLGVLDTTMQQVVADLSRGDAEQLLVNGRFLKEKFGKPDFSL